MLLKIDEKLTQKKYPVLRWVFYFITLCLAFSLVLLLVFRPYLVINMTSNISGVSQVFLSKGSSYSEENSIVRRVNIGQNVLRFPLYRLNSSIRWDPLTQGSNVEVNNIYISIFGLKVSDIYLNPIHDIENIKSIDNKFYIMMNSNANDPQINIQADFLKYIKNTFYYTLL